MALAGPPRPPDSAPNFGGGRRRPWPRAVEPLSSCGSTPEVDTPRREPEAIAERPSTHCGAPPRIAAFDEEVADGEPQRPSTGCGACCKLRLRLEHAERARVKAQEQLVRMQQENLRLRRGGYAGETAGDGISADEEVARTLEGYRREVSFLKQSLAEQKAQEAQLREEMRCQQRKDRGRLEVLQGQVASLMLDLAEAKKA
ncbi:unnamed protein product [Effrenium voratum]|uniref:Uncharacterized protein n=1 Tax=Effrenium voratum TaxID=2562239 RepID=A0AA36HUD5_9DINO|nr:unnamed protein product [Effrenium voratum]CAJ1422142.1 unnamed protein product [Effrenium voratum]